MNILFFGKKRVGSGSHEYQRHVIRNMPIKAQDECYGRKLMMDNQTYFFDRFDYMGNAVFVDDQWDEEVDTRWVVAEFAAEHGRSIEFVDVDRMYDGCPCHKE